MGECEESAIALDGLEERDGLFGADVARDIAAVAPGLVVVVVASGHAAERAALHARDPGDALQQGMEVACFCHAAMI